MLDRLIDRLPALLLLLVLLFSAHVAVFDARENGRLLAVIPGAVLLVLYLRAGSGEGGGGGKGKGKKKATKAGGDED